MTLVEHADWGHGTVLASEGDRLTVLFDAGGYKELAAGVVLGEHLLTPLDGLPARTAVSRHATRNRAGRPNAETRKK